MESPRLLRALAVCAAFAVSPIGGAEPRVELLLAPIVVDGASIEVLVGDPKPARSFSPLAGLSVSSDTVDGYRLSVDTAEVRFHSPWFIYDFYVESPAESFHIPVQLKSSLGFDHTLREIGYLLRVDGVEREGKITLPIYSHMPRDYLEIEVEWTDSLERVVEADLENSTFHDLILRNRLNDFNVLVERNGPIRETGGLRPRLIVAGSDEAQSVLLPAGAGATATVQLELDPTLGAALSQAFMRKPHEVKVPLRHQAAGVGTIRPISIRVGVRIVPSLPFLVAVWGLGVVLGTWMSYERYRRKEWQQTWRDLRICVLVALAVTAVVFFLDSIGNAVVLLGHKVDPYHPLAALILGLFVSFNSRRFWHWLKGLRVLKVKIDD